MAKRARTHQWPPGVDDATAASLEKDARRALRRLARRDERLAEALVEAERRRRRLAEAIAAGRKGRKRRRRLATAEADVQLAAEEVLALARSVEGPAAAFVWPSVAAAEGALAHLGEEPLGGGLRRLRYDRRGSGCGREGARQRL